MWGWERLQGPVGAAVGIAFIVFLMAVGGLSQPHHDRYAQNIQQPKAQDAKPAIQQGPRAITASDHNTDHWHPKKQEGCQYNGPRWFAGFYCFFADHEKFWLSFGTLILACATAILGWATIFLWRATRQLVIDARETGAGQVLAAKAAAEATKEAAGAAKRSADVAESALVLTDRAWIDIKIDIVGPLEFATDKVKATISCTLQNIGRSPARSVEIVLANMYPSTIEANDAARKTEENARLYVAAAVIGGPVLFPGKEAPAREFNLSMDRKVFLEAITAFNASITQEDLDTGYEPITTLDPVVAFGVYYLLPTGGRPRYSIFLYEIKPADPNKYGFDGREDEMHDVRLVQTFGGKAI